MEDTNDSTAAHTSQARAMCLLAAIRARTEHNREPVPVMSLAHAAQLTPEQAEAAWRYLRDHRLIDTNRLDYTARINARGIDTLDGMARASVGLATAVHPAAPIPDTLDRRDLPELPRELLSALRDLWQSSVSTDQPVDAPIYRDMHRTWLPLLAELERRRCIARDTDRYRLTPLGLLSVHDPDADDVVRLGERIRTLLADRYRNPVTRNQSVLVDELSRTLNVPINYLSSRLFHLSDAIGRWCAQFTPDFTARNAAMQPAERVLEALSIADIARELASWAASSSTAEIAAGNFASGLPTATLPVAESEPVADRWIKNLKNNRPLAVVVVFSAIIIAAGTVVENGHRLLELLPNRTPASTLPPPNPYHPISMDDVLSRDMTLPIDLCVRGNGPEPVVECVTHGGCRGDNAQGLGYAIDKTSKETAVSSCKLSCKAEAARTGVRCATPPLP